MGSTSPDRDPTRYMQYIRRVFDHYTQHFIRTPTHIHAHTHTLTHNTHVPLVINTPGWTKGVCVCMYCGCVCVYVCMYVCMCMCVCVCVRVCV